MSTGAFLDVPGSIAGIDVVRAADRRQAAQLASTHPLARHQVIEVEQFHVS